MAKPTCVMHPFSYTTPASFSNDIHQGNCTMYGMEESVSFGRFMSDNLEWEKWSSFNSNRNRYVEEAEKYSKPGSVAQKKAYFEAHFKRIAALKAAALLEQANPSENSSDGKTDGKGVDETTQGVENLSINLQIEPNNSKEVEIVNKGSEKEDARGEVVHQNVRFSDVTKNELESSSCKNEDPAEHVELHSQNKAYSVAVKGETCNGSKDSKSYGIGHRDKPPLQKRSSYIEEASESIAKKNPPLSSYMSPTVGGIVHPGKENYATPTKETTNVTDQDKKKTPLRLSINREINRIISPVIRRIGTSSKGSGDCSTPLKTPAKTLNAALESPQMTPSRWTRSRLDSFAGGSQAPGSRWHIFSSGASMSPSTSKHRINSPIIPNLFCMSGERAARRKQEKAEAELKRIRQSFCFKAMSSPDHHGENEALTAPKQKDEPKQGKSPKRGKQPPKTTSKTSLHPRRPFIKQSGSTNVQKNNHSSAIRTK